DRQVAKRVIIEIDHRIKTLLDVGLGYLTLNRLANSLSGGESQRIQLIRLLKELRDLGNTVVVVEHDEMMMREADHIIDMGPLASHLGGEVVASGDYDEIIANESSLTGKYLSGEFKVVVPGKVRKWNSSISIEGARQHNL